MAWYITAIILAVVIAFFTIPAWWPEPKTPPDKDEEAKKFLEELKDTTKKEEKR